MRNHLHLPTPGDIILCRLIGPVRVTRILNGRIRAQIVESGKGVELTHDDWRSYFAPRAGSFDEVLHAA